MYIIVVLIIMQVCIIIYSGVINKYYLREGSGEKIILEIKLITKKLSFAQIFLKIENYF